jgi:hypothetical protein
MGVVFDEVVGEVAPEPTPPAEPRPSVAAPPQPPDPHEMTAFLRRLAERAERLIAD